MTRLVPPAPNARVQTGLPRRCPAETAARASSTLASEPGQSCASCSVKRPANLYDMAQAAGTETVGTCEVEPQLLICQAGSRLSEAPQQNDNPVRPQSAQSLSRGSDRKMDPKPFRRETPQKPPRRVPKG